MRAMPPFLQRLKSTQTLVQLSSTLHDIAKIRRANTHGDLVFRSMQGLMDGI